MSEEARTRWTIALNAAIVVLCAVAWCQMVFGWGWEHAPLSGLGLSSLKYFTIQSNLLSALVSAACVFCLVRGGGRSMPDWLHGMRLVATTGVALTFVTVEAFLSPALYGYASMHAGANLWFHLVLPLLAIASFCVLEADRPMPVSWTFAAIVPMVLYGVGYLANILANGIPGNDWYGFTAWGMERIPIVFAVMVAVVWLIACGLRAANQRVYRMRAL